MWFHFDISLLYNLTFHPMNKSNNPNSQGKTVNLNKKLKISILARTGGGWQEVVDRKKHLGGSQIEKHNM